MTAAGYPVPVMMRPPVVPSPVGPADMDHWTPQSSTGSVDCSSAILSLPVVSTPEGGQSSRTAPMDIGHQSSSSLFGGEPAGRPLPPVSLTPRPTGASPHVGDSDADGGALLSREGPFDIHQGHPHSGVLYPKSGIHRHRTVLRLPSGHHVPDAIAGARLGYSPP